MRKIIFLFLLSVFFTAACVIYVPVSTEEGPPPPRGDYYSGYSPEVDISYFYDYLSDFGIWIHLPGYDYVWIPRAISYSWHPYTYGRWLWTDWGWTWVSYFEWGWGPFHYGRWGFDHEIGWFWVPGTVWGPAWVSWRRSNLYIGWAPLPPQVKFEIGIGLTSLPYSLPLNFWVFVEGPYFLNPNIHRYILPYERNLTIINFTVRQTNIIVRNQRVINQGLDVNFVSQITREKITPYELREIRKPQLSRVQLKRVEIYKPVVTKKQMAKPKHFVEKQQAKEEISRISIKRTLRSEEPEFQKVDLRSLHQRQLELLEKSQQDEIKELEEQYVKKMKEVKSSSEKEKIEKEYKEKIAKLKKLHKTEKSKLEKRHKEEEKKVKKKKIKK